MLNMNTVELDAERAAIIRQLFAIDSRELLDSVQQLITSFVQRKEYDRPPCQFSVEELKRVLAESDDGGDDMSHEDFLAELEKEEGIVSCR